MNARETAAKFQALVVDLRVAAVSRVLAERNIKDEGGDLARQILAAIEVDSLARDAWNNGKRNAAELAASTFDQWWQVQRAKSGDRR